MLLPFLRIAEIQLRFKFFCGYGARDVAKHQQNQANNRTYRECNACLLRYIEKGEIPRRTQRHRQNENNGKARQIKCQKFFHVFTSKVFLLMYLK